MYGQSIFRAALLAFACIAALPTDAATVFSGSTVNGLSNQVTATSQNSEGGGGVTGAPIFANQAITNSPNATITIPAGLTFALVTGGATVAESGGRLTVRLSAGARFTATPVATLYTVNSTNANATSPPAVAISTVGVGSLSPDGNGVVFFLGAQATTAKSTSYIQLSSFSVSGATILATAGNNLTITAQTQGFTKNAGQLNDASAVFATLATSTSGVIATMTPGPGDTIAIASDAIATQFNAYDPAAGASTPTVLSNVADLGKIALSLNLGAQNAADSAAYAPAGTGTLKLFGTFQNYAGAYLAPGATCTSATPPAGAITGTVTPTSITFTGVGQAATTQAFCLIANGNSVLSATGNVQVTLSLDNATQTVGTLSPGILYGGSVFRLPLVAGSSATLTGYLRLVNTSSVQTPIFGIVQSDSGVTFTGTLATLSAQTAVLITQDQALGRINASAAFVNGATGRMTVLAPMPALGTPILGVTTGNASGVSASAIVMDNLGEISNLN